MSPEWVAEWVVHWSRSWDFVKALELAGRFTLLVAVVSWFLEADDREKARQDAVKAKHYRAWELINSARDSTGDGGRRYALQDLNEDRVSLLAAPLAQAHLAKINLPRADLREANLTRAILVETNLTEAVLIGAKLVAADLSGANLTETNLWAADLTGADLTRANLTGANLGEAKLIKANLREADLAGAIVGDFPLEGPPGWLPSAWEVYDSNGIARLRRSGAPSIPP